MKMWSNAIYYGLTATSKAAICDGNAVQKIFGATHFSFVDDHPLREVRAGESTGLLSLLTRSGPYLDDLGVEVETMEFQDERLDLELHVPKVQDLEWLKKALRANTGLDLEILSVETAQGAVDSRIRIRSIEP